MAMDTLVKEASDLPEDYIAMIIEYIHFLKFRRAAASENGVKKHHRKLGILADCFHSMADDFDETPDGFEEYM